MERKKRRFGNQYTGTRKNIIAEAGKYAELGKKLFWVGTVTSVVQGGIAIYEGNTGGAIKAGADIVVGMIATWGGPVGWAIGGIYLFLDLVGAFEQSHFQGVSPYANNPHIHLRDKTYVNPPIMPNSGKGIKNTDMNVWKYIYIKFYEFRRWILGKTLGEVYAAMLFVASLDCLFYWGIVTFVDGFTGYHLLPKYKPLYAFLFIGGALIIEKIRKRSMCKEGVFERMK